jgi:acyl-CoA thioesterase II
VVFTAQISFNIQEETSIEHQCKMPSVPPPEDLRTTQENAKHFVELEEKGELQLSSHVQKELRKRLTIDDDALFQFKPVTPKHYFAIEPFAPETISHWIKFKANNIGEDRNLHRFLVAFITDATLVAVANRPHKSHGFLPSMLFSLDHSVHFHDDNFRADEWMLYENWSPIAKNGRAYSEGRLWSRDGRLILSATQESLCRTRAGKSQL